MAQQRLRWIGGGIAALALLGGGWWFFQHPGGGQDAEQAAAEASPTSAAPTGGFALSAQQARALDIAWAVAGTAQEASIATIPGTIAPPANARVAVTALFPGAIERMFVVEGDTVQQGQALAVVRSTDVVSLRSDLARAQARVGAARAGAGRLSQLAREGVIAAARAEEARAALREAEADAAESRRMLAMAGASGDGRYTLRAPIAGRVAVASATTGDRLDGSSAPFVIDAAGEYEVNAQLPQRLAGQVRPGMTVRLGGGAAGDVSGTVTAVGATVDSQTRALLLKARIPAGGGVIAGGSVTLVVFGPAPAGAVLVPASAVTSVNGADVVFVASGNGVRMVPVRLGPDGGGGNALILSGVRAGERVVARGTAELKSLALAQ